MQQASGPAPHELILDHLSADGPSVVRVRGTLLAASLNVVKEAGLYDKYLELLPEALHEPILYSLASSWLPVQVALAHYENCERLAISDDQIEQNAARVGERLGQTFMANLLRSVRKATGVETSWSVLKQADRLWDRVYAGGGCRVYRVDRKDALFEFCGLPLARCRYYRVAHVANIRALVGMFSERSYVRAARPLQNDPTTLAIALSWV